MLHQLPTNASRRGAPHCGALRDRGIPVWQDIADLPTTPIEEELRRVLADSATASAILFVTPEVEHSNIIRKVEAPGIVNRHMKSDGFFAVPVAAGRLNYSDLERVLGPHLGLAHMPGWNVLRMKAEPLDNDEAMGIADFALRQRLAAIQGRSEKQEPLPILVSTRAPLPKTPGPALAIDLTHRFSGRMAVHDVWQSAILPGFRSIVREIQSSTPGRNVELSGLIAIPAAVALGVSFLSQSGIRISWIQEQGAVGRSSAAWSLQQKRKPSGFQVVTHPRTAGANDIAALVSVAADVTADFNATTAVLPPLRAVVSVAPDADHGDGKRVVISAGQALDVAHLTVDALRSARTRYHANGTVHLFLAVPVGLAFMIGQLLNTFGSVQSYEHIPGDAVPYKPVAFLHPSV